MPDEELPHVTEPTLIEGLEIGKSYLVTYLHTIADPPDEVADFRTMMVEMLAGLSTAEAGGAIMAMGMVITGMAIDLVGEDRDDLIAFVRDFNCGEPFFYAVP